VVLAMLALRPYFRDFIESHYQGLDSIDEEANHALATALVHLADFKYEHAPD
jgi:hypothetical protein